MTSSLLIRALSSMAVSSRDSGTLEHISNDRMLAAVVTADFGE